MDGSSEVPHVIVMTKVGATSNDNWLARRLRPYGWLWIGCGLFEGSEARLSFERWMEDLRR